MLFLIMKTDSFRGALTDVSAETKSPWETYLQRQRFRLSQILVDELFELQKDLFLKSRFSNSNRVFGGFADPVNITSDN